MTHPFPKSAATIRKAMAEVGVAVIDYTNWRGERSERRVIPISIKFGANEWHKDQQWMMLAHDVEKGADRWFAMSGIHSWKTPTEQIG